MSGFLTRSSTLKNRRLDLLLNPENSMHVRFLAAERLGSENLTTQDLAVVAKEVEVLLLSYRGEGENETPSKSPVSARVDCPCAICHPGNLPLVLPPFLPADSRKTVGLRLIHSGLVAEGVQLFFDGEASTESLPNEALFDALALTMAAESRRESSRSRVQSILDTLRLLLDRIRQNDHALNFDAIAIPVSALFADSELSENALGIFRDFSFIVSDATAPVILERLELNFFRTSTCLGQRAALDCAAVLVRSFQPSPLIQRMAEISIIHSHGKCLASCLLILGNQNRFIERFVDRALEKHAWMEISDLFDVLDDSDVAAIRSRAMPVIVEILGSEWFDGPKSTLSFIKRFLGKQTTQGFSGSEKISAVRAVSVLGLLDCESIRALLTDLYHGNFSADFISEVGRLFANETVAEQAVYLKSENVETEIEEGDWEACPSFFWILQQNVTDRVRIAKSVAMQGAILLCRKIKNSECRKLLASCAAAADPSDSKKFAKETNELIDGWLPGNSSASLNTQILSSIFLLENLALGDLSVLIQHSPLAEIRACACVSDSPDFIMYFFIASALAFEDPPGLVRALTAGMDSILSEIALGLSGAERRIRQALGIIFAFSQLGLSAESDTISTSLEIIRKLETPKRSPQNRSTSPTLEISLRPEIPIFSVIDSVATLCDRSSESPILSAISLLSIFFARPDIPMSIVSLVPDEIWLNVLPQLIGFLVVPGLMKIRSRFVLNRLIKRFPHQTILFILAAVESENREVSAESLGILSACLAQDLLAEYRKFTNGMRSLAVSEFEWFHSKIETASSAYFVRHDSDSMHEEFSKMHIRLSKLLSHREAGVLSVSQLSFLAANARDLLEAHALVTRDELDSAWRLYSEVSRRIGNSRESSFRLEAVAQELVAVENSRVILPGDQHTISAINPEITLMPSKQRPRMLEIQRADGKVSRFLLKGNEDLRGDEFAMQILNLVNEILSKIPCDFTDDFLLQTFPVIPLGSCGLIDWVPKCDTLHSLIKRGRELRGKSITAEYEKIKLLHVKYEDLPILQKTEIFDRVTDEPPTEILDALKLQSVSFKDFDARRIRFARSAAAASIVGYVLGLGDRHPSNIMISRLTGKAVHIDFADLFEVTKTREKFPERVPFRFTGAMRFAMGEAGQQEFVQTAELVMGALRDNEGVLIAAFEFFIRDPLITWERRGEISDDTEVSGSAGRVSRSSVKESKAQLAEAALERVKAKLKGAEFCDEGVTVKEQVRRLIDDAVDPENLCQSYVGWCPFW